MLVQKHSTSCFTCSASTVWNVITIISQFSIQCVRVVCVCVRACVRACVRVCVAYSVKQPVNYIWIKPLILLVLSALCVDCAPDVST